MCRENQKETLDAEHNQRGCFIFAAFRSLNDVILMALGEMSNMSAATICGVWSCRTPGTVTIYRPKIPAIASGGSGCFSEALPPLVLRLPGETRKHLLARLGDTVDSSPLCSEPFLSRSLTISSPFERKGSQEPIYLYLHMMDRGADGTDTRCRWATSPLCYTIICNITQ